MKTQFFNRCEAGKLLAENLSVYIDRDDVLVLALPRGGVPVAAEVAKTLKAPLDIFVCTQASLSRPPGPHDRRNRQWGRARNESGRG